MAMHGRFSLLCGRLLLQLPHELDPRSCAVDYGVLLKCLAVATSIINL